MEDGALEANLVEGRRVRLRPVTLRDYDWLFELYSQPEFALRFRRPAGAIDPQTFGQALWNNVYCQMLIEARTSGESIGLAVAYQPDLVGRTAYVAVLIDPRSNAFGWGLEGGRLFVHYLFMSADFRKLYMEAVDRNMPGYSSAIGRGLHEEGRLRKHVYSQGEYRDTVIMALYRQEWSAHRRSPLRGPTAGRPSGNGTESLKRA